MKSSPRWLAKRTPLPSGVQSSTMSSAEWVVSRVVTAPPLGRDHVNVHVPLAIGEKAIALPSGENRGKMSRALLTVRR